MWITGDFISKTPYFLWITYPHLLLLTTFLPRFSVDNFIKHAKIVKFSVKKQEKYAKN